MLGGPPWVLRVVARGYIGPTLIRQDLDHAAAFGRSHPEGWWYVVDPTDVVPNPVNVAYLKSISRLPNVRGYLVIARRRPMRTAARLLSRLGGPDRVFASDAEALAHVAEENDVAGTKSCS
ncbi:MAG: hypothetical protein QOG87_158 [Actinomycetota bacterium]